MIYQVREKEETKNYTALALAYLITDMPVNTTITVTKIEDDPKGMEIK